MLDAFRTYSQQQNLLAPGGKSLLAVSGGVDSVVLCYLFHAAGWPFEIAHCNFQLRGTASDGDENFVQELAARLGVAFHSTRFNTMQTAENEGISIQLAARQLRYRWLETVRQLSGSQVIATAHHLDDSIETVIFNFSKGCGLRGLHGIIPVQGKIIRPLLFATKAEITGFAKQENITFREDASNTSVKYTRNKIRKEVVPVLREINPSFQQSAGETIGRLKEAEALYDFALRQIHEDIVSESSDGLKINLEKLRSCPAPSTVLYELVAPYGFNNDQVAQMLEHTHQPGIMFYSPTHRLLVDRSDIELTPAGSSSEVITIPGIPEKAIQLPGGKLILQHAAGPPRTFKADAGLAWFDLDKLAFPLILRHWQPGDYFQPLGMNGHHKKLQDFFSDQKLSRFDKEKIWLLESGGRIAWVLGMRADERFKVTTGTKDCLSARYEPDTFET